MLGIKPTKRQAVKKAAIKEAEVMFKKMNPKMAMKDGSFPKTGPMMTKAYNKEAKRVQKQVVKTRLAQKKK